MQARQAPPLQMGVADGQSPWPTQPTQAPVPPQKGSAPAVRMLHSAFDEQLRQTPEVALQNGVVPEQPMSSTQATH